MRFNIHHFELKHRHFPTKQGLLLESLQGKWSEVSPLPGRSEETLQDALDQLQALQNGWSGPLLPSVAFGIYSLTAPPILSAPCAPLFTGTPKEVLKMAAEMQGFKTAKLKVGPWKVDQALDIIQHLSNRFRLRIDFNSAWKKTDIDWLCSRLAPDQIEFLEDPGYATGNFPVASDAETLSSCIQVWKPMVRGLPQNGQSLILSSALESSIGLQSIASLITSHNIPHHIVGLGTILYTENDLVRNSAWLKEGHIHFPPSWEINWSRLVNYRRI